MIKRIYLGVLIALLIGYASPSQAIKVSKDQVIFDELADFKLCIERYNSGDYCYDALKRWVKDHPGDAFQAGKNARQKMNARSATPFFAQAFNDKKGDCKDEDVKLATLDALDLPPDPESRLISSAKDIALKYCFAELKDALVDAATVGSGTFKNVCKELVAKKLLTEFRAKTCK